MDDNTREGKCQAPVETFSRCVGFFRPVQQWNKGKKEEFNERKTYDIPEMGGYTMTAFLILLSIVYAGFMFLCFYFHESIGWIFVILSFIIAINVYRQNKKYKHEPVHANIPRKVK